MTERHALRRPGGVLSRRPLHLFWICDTSGSMRGAKIQALNQGIREALLEMTLAADDHPEIELLVRAMAFDRVARWIDPHPVHVALYREWFKDLQASDGATELGRALDLLVEALDPARMPARGFRPVIVLLSDGCPTDAYEPSLQRLLASPWGRRAVRLAIAIGGDADFDVLQRFIADPAISPLRAHNPEQLVRYIRWYSTMSIRSVAAPASLPRNERDAVPPPPESKREPDPPADGDLVW